MITLNPSPTMSFKDFPFESKDVFENQHMHQATFLNYVKEYACKFDLYNHIIFDSIVQKITKNGDTWEVKVKIGKDVETKIFDYVCLCIGHNHCPKIPSQEELVNLEEFKGDVVHSS